MHKRPPPRVELGGLPHVTFTRKAFMGPWERLFIDGEFMSQAHLHSGLTVEQVSMRPSGLPHTIYEELWHTTKWQSIVIQCGDRAAAAWIDGGQDFPSEAPGNERMWVPSRRFDRPARAHRTHHRLGPSRPAAEATLGAS